MKREKGVQNSEERERRTCKEPVVCLLVHLENVGKASVSGVCPLLPGMILGLQRDP